jgi:hypothetical protein
MGRTASNTTPHPKRRVAGKDPLQHSEARAQQEDKKNGVEQQKLVAQLEAEGEAPRGASGKERSRDCPGDRSDEQRQMQRTTQARPHFVRIGIRRQRYALLLCLDADGCAGASRVGPS